MSIEWSRWTAKNLKIGVNIAHLTIPKKHQYQFAKNNKSAYDNISYPHAVSAYPNAEPHPFVYRQAYRLVYLMSLFMVKIEYILGIIVILLLRPSLSGATVYIIILKRVKDPSSTYLIYHLRKQNRSSRASIKINGSSSVSVLRTIYKYAGP